MKKMKTIVIATAIATLLSATAAFADTTSSNMAQTLGNPQTQSYGANGWFQSHLDSLVTAGTITQAQETAIEAAMSSSTGNSHRGHNGGFLNSLVTAGTITQAQETAIQTAMSMATKSKAGMQTALDSLVTAGTITQAQETAIEAAMSSSTGNSHRGHNDGLKTALDSLVTAGTITQAQETAILGS